MKLEFIEYLPEINSKAPYFPYMERIMEHGVGKKISSLVFSKVFSRMLKVSEDTVKVSFNGRRSSLRYVERYDKGNLY